jgi:hypothetical protein
MVTGSERERTRRRLVIVEVQGLRRLAAAIARLGGGLRVVA